MELPAAFIEQMKKELGDEATAFFSTYNERSRVGLRRSRRHDWTPGPEFAPVPWCADGFYVPEGLRMGREPLHAAGAYYLQEPSAMAPVSALEVKPGMRVLDLCAAPGGKSTQIADLLEGKGILVANEIHPTRARILLENIERMGVTNALVLNEKPDRIASHFGAWFDAVLVDAPCSGEGMFRRDPQAVEQWNADAPALCHARQLEILEKAAQCLRGGGTLVYSTCTFNHLENEETIAEFLRTHKEFQLDESLSLPGIQCRGGMAHLYPHRLEGEGHFLARLRKCGMEQNELPELPAEKADPRFSAFEKDTLRLKGTPRLLKQGEWLYLLAEGMPDPSGLHVLRAGVQAGRLAAGRFEPAHALALALAPEEFRSRCALEREQALRFLHGETVPGENSGWCAVTFENCVLGWGKGSNGQIKNHIPKGLRWNI